MMGRCFNLLRSLVFWLVFLVGTFLIALFSPLIKIVFAKSEKVVQGLIKLFLHFSLRLSNTKVNITGLSNIPQKNGFIIAANHNSFVDSFVLIGELPVLFKIVAFKSGFSLPLIGRIFRGAGYISTGLTMNFGDQIILYKALKRNENILIYGRIAGENVYGNFTEAMVSFARQAGIPILPVCLVGSSKVLPMGKFILQAGSVSVRIGDPIHDPDLNILQDKMRELYHRSV